jgi:UDP-N-acetylmuramoyl-tripeptide--D-alanyl-D-alanine ligase
MEQLKSLLKIFKYIFPFSDFVYLFQIEEYSLQRFWFWFPRFFFRRNIIKRDTLKFTKRASLIYLLAVLIFITKIFYIYKLDLNFKLLLIILVIILIPIFILISNIIFIPIFNLIHLYYLNKAKRYFKNKNTKTKVILITGSFGKTTLKYFLYQILKPFYKVLITEGNINSLSGLSHFILNKFESDTEILILETDSYKKGEIKEITKLLNPYISVVTNIKDQHLQRYKTKLNLAKSLYEIFEYSDKNNIKITDDETLSYLKENNFNVDNINIISKSNLDSSYKKNKEYALFISSYFRVDDEYKKHISENLKIPDRRGETKEIFGFNCIDNSYNISFETGVKSVMEAKRQADSLSKKLVVITAGIPELSKDEYYKNEEFGKILEKNVDKVIILKSIFYKEVSNGFKDESKKTIVKNFSDAIKDLSLNYDKDKWLVLIEPELTDIYY